MPRRHCSACRAAAQASERRADDFASPYFQYGDSHCCEVSFGFRLPWHRPCRIFFNACALERVLPPSVRPTDLCRAPPCCFPLLVLQPHRASLSSFSRRATCESRRRALSRSTPPASRWQPLLPRCMPALPPHARAVLLFWRAPGNSMPCRRAALLVASKLCEPPSATRPELGRGTTHSDLTSQFSHCRRPCHHLQTPKRTPVRYTSAVATADCSFACPRHRSARVPCCCREPGQAVLRRC